MRPAPDSPLPPTAAHRAAVLAGHRGDAELARSLLTDPDSRARASALSALVRLESVTKSELETAMGDPEPFVRRRCAVSVAHCTWATVSLLPLLNDSDPTVIEVACWAVGEVPLPDTATLDALIDIAAHHDDALCRESAVAALGSLGDPDGKAVVMAACSDRATVRRRAVLALAAFDGDDVTIMLGHLLEDRDLQVRQAAEDLLSIIEGSSIGAPSSALADPGSTT